MVKNKKRTKKIPEKYTARLSRRDKSKQKKNKRRKKVKITRKK
jgi:predicted transcriptional regulator